MDKGFGFVITGYNKTQAAFAGVKRDINGMSGAARGFVTAFAPAIAAMATFGRISSSLDAADRMNDLAQQTGVAVESMSRFGYMAKMSGTDVEVFAKSAQKMNVNIGEFANGSAGATKTFGELGLSLRDLQGLAPEQQFAAIADKIAALPTHAQQAAAAVSVFGKSGAELLPILQQGGAGFAQMAAEADAFGATLSKTEAEKIALFNDGVDKMGFVVDKVARETFLFFHDAASVSFGGAVMIVQTLDSAFRFTFAAIGKHVMGFVQGMRAAFGTMGSYFTAFKQDLAEFASNPLGANGFDKLAKATSVGITDSFKAARGEIIAEGNKMQADIAREYDKSIATTRKKIDDFRGANGAPTNKLAQKKGFGTGGDENEEIGKSHDKLTSRMAKNFGKMKEDATDTASEMKDAFANSLSGLSVDFDNFGSSARSVLQSVAASLLKVGINRGMDALFGGASEAARPSASFVGPMPASGGFSLPSFDVGIDRVPHDMLAMIHEDEAVLKKPVANAYRTGNLAAQQGGGGGVNITQNITIDASGGNGNSAAIIRAAAEEGARKGAQMVMNDFQRGGAISRTAGKA